MTVHSQLPTEMHEPPPPARQVLIVGIVGVGLVVAAMVFGLVAGAPLRGFDTHRTDGPRALLSCIGLLVTGCAISMRPNWYGGWLCGAAAALIGYGVGLPPPAGTEWYIAPPRDWFAGVPNSWDSIQLFFGVACAIGLVGAAWTRLPRRAILALILFGAAYHFAGIFAAITSPAPTPFLTDQYWRRVARQYLIFAYMNNAYQFYSPDPGPASELWICIDYKPEGEADKDLDVPKECTWIYVPRRAHDYKDPLGLSFYRRLSLTENASHYHRGGYFLPPAEAGLVEQRRRSVDKVIPQYGHLPVQRLVPVELVSRQILPSYARHLAKAYARPEPDAKGVKWDVRGIKIYRTEHTIVSLDQFVGFEVVTNTRVDPWSPYNASLYMPYFLGEFDADGNLKDSQAPMLYWLVPIMPSVDTPPLSAREYRDNGGFDRYFKDYVSDHAGCKRPKE